MHLPRFSDSRRIEAVCEDFLILGQKSAIGHVKRSKDCRIEDLIESRRSVAGFMGFKRKSKELESSVRYYRSCIR